MTFTSLTPLSRSSSSRPAWGQLLGLLALGLTLLLGACSTDVSGIGVGLPGADATTGAYLIDTLTVRTSTVLRDSVVTSGTSSLLVGRYTDPLLGTVQAKSYFRLGPGAGGTLVPDAAFVYDSLVLTLSPSSGSTAYRYGDTTKTQTLVSVYRMNTPVPTNKVCYASAKLTPLGSLGDAPLNRRTPVRRASPVLGTLRVRLADTLGTRLLTAGKLGRLQTADQLLNYLPGLAISSASTDDAALLTFDATSANTALVLYYHDPANSTVALSSPFTVSTGGARCYQVDVDRSKGAIGNQLPTQSLQAVSASLTGERTVIEGALGLQTKVEIPYIRDLTQFGQHLTLTSAQLVAEVPAATLTPYVPAVASIQPSLTNLRNQPIAAYGTTVDYKVGTSATTTLDQGSYTFSVLGYLNGVLAGTTPNNGLLLASATPALPTRVVLASQRGQLSKLQLRVYVISTN